MVVDGTNSLNATSTRAGISTFLAYTSTVGRTLGVANTFGSTAFIGITDVIVDTFACEARTTHTTFSVASAGRWSARILRFLVLRWQYCNGNNLINNYKYT